MAVIVPARALLRSSSPTRSIMSRMSFAASQGSEAHSATQKQPIALEHERNLEEEKKNAAQLVKALAERYGERAVQRWSTEGEQEASSTSSTLGSSPTSTYKPFSSTWAARYWQLQKVKAEQMLAELDQVAREKSMSAEGKEA
jgi:nucleotidyltransferase/DNA polymerase involved in DNA repair